MKKLILLFFILSCSLSCLNESFEDLSVDGTKQGADIAFQENFGASVRANFIGQIVDVNGTQLSDVQIIIGNAVTITDHRGVFVLNDVSVFEKFAFVKANKNGYLKGSRTLVPLTTSTNDIQITLLEKNVIETISSGVEAEVVFNNSKVQFLGDYIDSNGSVYNGQVEVSMHYLAPNAEETFAQMPGMLFGQATNNDAVSLETYSMLAIDLFSPSGEQLNIAESSPATIEFPVDIDQTAIAPRTINLWYFDDAVGYWKEEGTATKVGNKYIAEVTHFTWWNCDLPIDYVNVCFTLEAENGNLANNYVEIIRNETSQTIFYGQTNAAGEECGVFPANEQVTIKIYGEQECQDEIIYEEVIGPFSNDTNFTVNVPLSNIEVTTISATINNCFGNPLTNGYAFIFNENNSITFGEALNIDNGIIQYTLAYCESEANDYKIIIYNLDDMQNSGIIPINSLIQGITDLGILSTCEEAGGAFVGDVHLETQKDINDFGLFGYTKIEGSLKIGMTFVFGGPTSNISNLSPLSEITEVTNELYIFNNPLLNSLERLNNIIKVEKLRVLGNNRLENLNGLENIVFAGISVRGNNSLESLSALSNVSGDIDFIFIMRNPSLVNLIGLNGLTSIGEFIISGNDNLASLEGLNNVTSFGRFTINNNDMLTSLNFLNDSVIVTDWIDISFNDRLASLEGLENTTSLRSISIERNDSLQSLEGLNGVSSLSGTIRILRNAGLTSLEGLNMLDFVGGSVLIGIPNTIGSEWVPDYGNDDLTDFCALQNLFINGSVGGETAIIYNAYNPTVQDIIDGNCSQ